jgi:8-oxo-dGTP diphosphatase
VKYINVAAGILIDDAGRVLLTERMGDSPFVGMWEFPGGKIAHAESPANAMCRELTEELGIEVIQFRDFAAVEHAYADRHVHIDFFVVTAWRGEPVGLDGQKLRWAQPKQLDELELLPADGPVLKKLRLMMRAGRFSAQ